MREFKKDFLINELDLPYNALEDRITSNSRWSIEHEIIFKHEGKYYQTYYSVGATESQDESPWQYDDDDIECNEVHQVDRVVKVWEAI